MCIVTWTLETVEAAKHMTTSANWSSTVLRRKGEISGMQFPALYEQSILICNPMAVRSRVANPTCNLIWLFHYQSRLQCELSVAIPQAIPTDCGRQQVLATAIKLAPPQAGHHPPISESAHGTAEDYLTQPRGCARTWNSTVSRRDQHRSILRTPVMSHQNRGLGLSTQTAWKQSPMKTSFYEKRSNLPPSELKCGRLTKRTCTLPDLATYCGWTRTG